AEAATATTTRQTPHPETERGRTSFSIDAGRRVAPSSLATRLPRSARRTSDRASGLSGPWTRVVDELLQSWHKARCRLCFHRDMRSQGPPTARQIYALAAALCEKNSEPFPETLAEASTQLERLRRELGHPAPHLADCPPRFRRRRGNELARRYDNLASV